MFRDLEVHANTYTVTTALINTHISPHVWSINTHGKRSLRELQSCEAIHKIYEGRQRTQRRAMKSGEGGGYRCLHIQYG